MRIPLVTLLCVGALGSFAPASVSAAIVQPVSRVGADQNQGGAADSTEPIITPDGRFVLFSSAANDLALMPDGGAAKEPFPPRINAFLRDRAGGTTTLASMNLTGIGGGNGDSRPRGLSQDGRYVLFESSASDLVSQDTNNASDVIVRDIAAETTILVSIGTNGSPGNGESHSATITPSGRFVAFVSAANNLVPDDTNGIPDVFVRDLLLGTTVLASPGASSNPLSRGGEAPDISDDGRYVAFYTTATNLVSGVSFPGELYVRDLVAGLTLHASAAAPDALLAATGSTARFSFDHALSADGGCVAFSVVPFKGSSRQLVFRYSLASGATDLIHTNGMPATSSARAPRALDITFDGRFVAFVARTNQGSSVLPCILVWDALSGAAQIASLNMANGVANGSCDWPVLTPNGRFVCFNSNAPELVQNAPSSGYHMYLRDLLLKQTRLVDASQTAAGFFVSFSSIPSLSADGAIVAFDAFGSESVETPGSFQVFANDVQTGEKECISQRHDGLVRATANAPSTGPTSLSQTGRFVAFSSLASNLCPNDTNSNRDVFVRDLRSGATLLASVTINGFSGNGMSFEPSISADGRFTAFTSTATNLCTGDTNKKRDVFVFDSQAGTVALASQALTGGSGNNSSFTPRITAEGKGLYFLSTAQNIAPGSFTAGKINLFWRNLEARTNLALTTSGFLGYAISPGGRYAAYCRSDYTLLLWDSASKRTVYTNTGNYTPLAVSPDGNRVAWVSSSSDLQIRQRSPLATLSLGQQSSGPRGVPGFSADGNWLVYGSSYTQGFIDTNSAFDVYLYHVPSQTKKLISRAAGSSVAANGMSDYPQISHDGRFVVFRSVASNLIPGSGPSSGLPNVFVHDQLTGATTLLSAALRGGPATVRCLAPTLSGDGRTLVFQSWASDLAEGDFNQAADLFAFTFLYADITHAAGEPPLISWPATPGQGYEVQFKNHLSDPWQKLESGISVTDGTATMLDASPDVGQRVYRILGL